MSILLVDDSKVSRLLIGKILNKGGYDSLVMAESAGEAFQHLGLNASGSDDPDTNGCSPDTKHPIKLILLDVVMPEMDGIEACRRIKAARSLGDIPVIMVTANTDNENLEMAFEAGAIDYVTKPINKVELLARVRSVLRLKREMDRRMELTLQLENANRELKRLTLIDGLTGIANRRHFDEFLGNEWLRNMRNKKQLSIIMVDIDFFKNYNDAYGHHAGDDCLRQVASILNSIAKRPSDLVARYGGEEFVVVLSCTDTKDAKDLGEAARVKICEKRSHIQAPRSPTM